MSHHESFAFESLEPRVLLSIAINVDYTYDAGGFFDDPARREVVEAAADYLGSLLNDSLEAIIPGGGNDWRIQFTDPSSGMSTQVESPTIDEDELLLFVGGRDLGGDTLGLGGAGGWQASGSNSFLLLVEGRGQSGATGPDAGQSDTSLWGGSIAFDTDTNWHFGLTTEGLAGNEHDFYSVALHEMLHVLGFTDGTPAFANLTSPSGEFMGPAAMAVSADTQLDTGDLAHWREGLTSAGQETLMDPTFSRGIRKLLTPLDFAALEDIGWEVTADRWPGRGSSIALSSMGQGISSGSASPGAPGLHWVDPSAAGVLDFRVTSDQPVTLRVWDSRGLLVDEVVTPDTVTGIGFSATDQFYTLEVISASSPATYDLAVSSGEFDEVAYYPEGFASPEVDQTVSISNPSDSAQLFTLELRYERGDLGRDFDTVAFERVIEPGQVITIDLALDGVFATDELSGRGILTSEPYAIVLHSTAPLGAALEHADEFLGQRITTAEDFVRFSNATWHFPRVEKATGVFDFITFYNPNTHDAEVSITFVALSAQLRLTQVVRAEARGGLNLQAIGALAQGAFGVIISSVAVDAADQSGHTGIVAAVTHFNSTQGDGWTALGTPGTLPASNTVPMADLPGGATDALIFNPGTTTARLRLVATTSMGDQVLAERFVPARAASAIVVPNALGYRFEFMSGVGVIQFVQTFDNEAVSARPQGAASRNIAFSLGDFDPASSDSYLRLNMFNVTMTNTSVNVRFLFANGPEIVQSVTVSGQRYVSLDINNIQVIRDRIADGPLSIVLESPQPLMGLLARLEGDTAWASGGMLLPA
ncbi:MAG: LEPR-XLL domain-containing protein [Phycisphaerales bacterium JB064]